jgi:AcrR family transcriptional regulator
MAGRATRSTRQDWVAAAYEAAGRGGVDAIAVEPIAATLGVTKGGFYYRFAAREELIAATLAHWSDEARKLMAQCSGIPDPVERLHSFLRTAVRDDKLRRADAWFFLHSGTHPLVHPVARHAAAENVAWFTGVLVEAGVPASEAGTRAHLCWSAYLGIVAGFVVAEAPKDRRIAFAELDLLVRVLVSPPGRRWPKGSGGAASDAGK